MSPAYPFLLVERMTNPKKKDLNLSYREKIEILAKIPY